jgi:hypothetical protein
MHKDVIGTASFGLDVEPILPDGWEEGMDLFASGSDETEEPIVDGQEADLLAQLVNETGKTEPDAPTTSEEGEVEEPSAEEGTTEPTDGPSTEQAPTSRILKLKVNHEEREIDVAKMSDEDLITLFQKGYAFDDVKDRESKKLYRSVYQEQIDAGMTEAAAKLIAKDVAGKAYALTDEEEAQTTAPAEPPAEPAAPGRDFKQEVEQLKALYPDFKEVPDEVAKAVAKGAPLLVAYLAYREKQSAKTAANLKQENKVLKQNAASAAKAPVRGVTGGGEVSAKPKKNIFESGFDAGLNWH